MPSTSPRSGAIRSLAWLAIVAGLLATGCGTTSRAADPSDVTEPPVTVTEIDGSDLKQLTLSARAAERLGLETAPVTSEASGGSQRLVIPYAALLYDRSGDTWVYAAIGPRTYVRTAVTVERVEADRAVLSDGPPVATEVVTVGVAELHGVESGVGGGH